MYFFYYISIADYICVRAPYFQPPVSSTRIQVSLSDFLDGPCQRGRWRFPCTRSCVGFLSGCVLVLLAASPLRASGRVKTDGLLFKVFMGNRLVDGPHMGEEELSGSRANKSPGCYSGDSFLPCLPPATPCTETRSLPEGQLWGAAAHVLGKEGFMDGTVREGSGYKTEFWVA